MRQVDLPAKPEPDERLHSGLPDGGLRPPRRSGNLRGVRQSGPAPPAGGDGLPEAQPLPDVDLRECGLRPPDPGSQILLPGLRHRGEVPAGSRSLGRGEGPPQGVGLRSLGRAAATSLHRPGSGGGAGGHPSRRAGLGSRSHLHGPDRGAHAGPQGQVYNSDCDAQHAAGRPGVRLYRLLSRRHAG